MTLRRLYDINKGTSADGTAYAAFEDNDRTLTPLDRANWIAVLPLGAHEQHGPHLPFDTDTLIAEGLVERLRHALPHDLACDLPADANRSAIRSNTWTSKARRSLAYRRSGRALARHRRTDLRGMGIRKFVMLNAHGGNSPLMTIVATEARVRFNMLAVATSWTRFGVPDGLIAPEDKAIDIHGGDIETSVMLALYPEKVDMAKAADFPPGNPTSCTRFKHLRAYGPHAFGWKMSDLNARASPAMPAPRPRRKVSD